MKRNRAIVILLVMGILGTGAWLRGEHVRTIRTVDLIQILASGACLGAATTLLVARRS